MNESQEILLSLIRQGDRSLPSHQPCWKEVMKLAVDQCVVGTALAGAERLDRSMLPSKGVLLQWIGMAESVKQRNQYVDRILVELTESLAAAGVTPLVVKGQVVAREYDEPLLRQSGDIDLLIAPSEWSAAEAWLRREKLMVSTSAAEKHVETDYHGVTIELHRRLNAFSMKGADRYWTEEVENKAWERSRTVEINGRQIKTLGATDTLVHLMVHAHHHLLTEGIGLRQLTDLSLFAANHFDEIDLTMLRRHIRGIGHEKAMTAFLALAGKYLGLPAARIPLELQTADYRWADRIMREVWIGGNFGRNNNLRGVAPGLLHSLNTARLVIAHSLRFYPLAPGEARAYWWNKIFWRMKRHGREQV